MIDSIQAETVVVSSMIYIRTRPTAVEQDERPHPRLRPRRPCQVHRQEDDTDGFGDQRHQEVPCIELHVGSQPFLRDRSLARRQVQQSPPCDRLFVEPGEGGLLQEDRGQAQEASRVLAANPTNYSKLGILSSVEAVAASLYIVGDRLEAQEFLSIFKWGQTFLTLNEQPLDQVQQGRVRGRRAGAGEEVFREFFPDEKRVVR